MNKNYRVIWSPVLGDFIVTSELAKGKIKSSSASVVNDVILPVLTKSFLISALVGSIIQPAFAVPAYGEYASGVGNMINIQDKDVATNETGAHGVFVEKGASATIDNVNVATTGSKAYAMYAAGAGSNIHVSGGNITTTGASSHGLVAGNSASVFANDVHINVNGTGLYANAARAEAKNIYVTSVGYGVYGVGKGATVNISDSEVSVSGNGAYAVLAENGAKTVSTNVDYSADGEAAFGGWVNTNSQLDITGGSITTSGSGSYGVYGKNGGIVNIDGVTVNSAGYGIYGIGTGTALSIANTEVFTHGDSVAGIHIRSAAVGSLNKVNVKATGNNTYGIFASGLGSNFTFSEGQIITQGTNGHGLVAGDHAEIVVDSVLIDSTGYGAYANKSVIHASNMFITSAQTGVYGTGENTYINISNSDISGGEANGGAVKASGSNVVIDVSNSKLTSTDRNASGLVAAYSGIINAQDVEINLLNGSYGLTTYFGGKIDVLNANINSISGGVGVFAASGGSINAKNLHVDIDNVAASDRESVAIWSSKGNVNYNNPMIDIEDSTFNIKGSKAIGVYTQNVNSEINLKNTAVLVENGTGVLAENAAWTTINLNNSVLASKVLLETGKADADANVGSIIINASNHSILSGDVDINYNKTDESSISLTSGSHWSGASKGLQKLNLADQSVWNITGNSSIDHLNVSDGTLIFNHDNAQFNTLTVNGNYHGDNATLMMNLALSDDKSGADQLHIIGDSSGSTKIQVHNAGGKGAKTLEGIKLIQVDGTQSGVFQQDGRIVAGAWDYALAQDSDGQWRLISSSPDVPGDGDKGGEGSEGNEGEGNEGGISPPTKPQPILAPRTRPEVGSYLANLAAENNMFILRADDRPGVTEYIDPVSGKREMTTMWLRNKASHGRFTDSTAQLKSITHAYMTQLGGDVAQWSSNHTDRFSIGVMAGYGNARSNTVSKVSGYSAKGQVNGYSLGLNVGWQQDSVTKSGGYLDSWMAYSQFNHSVKGQGLGQESYSSAGLTASLEGGYTFTFGELQNYSVQPKAQIIHFGIKTDDYVEQNGTRVSASGSNNLQTRLGIRAAMKGHNTRTSASQGILSPYIEMNWLHNSRIAGSTLDDVKVAQAGTRNIGETRLGIDAVINSNVGIWGGFAQQVGGKGFSDSSASLGVKVSFK